MTLSPHKLRPPRVRSAPLRGAALAALALNLALAPCVASAQEGGINLIRDTEIEETLHVDADPILRAAGLVPKDTTLILVGDFEPAKVEALAAIRRARNAGFACRSEPRAVRAARSRP